MWILLASCPPLGGLCGVSPHSFDACPCLGGLCGVSPHSFDPLSYLGGLCGVSPHSFDPCYAWAGSAGYRHTALIPAHPPCPPFAETVQLSGRGGEHGEKKWPPGVLANRT